MRRRMRVAWALFRRWLWLLWLPRLFQGWQATTTSVGREVTLFGGRVSFAWYRIVEVSAYQRTAVMPMRVFYVESAEDERRLRRGEPDGN